jgi:hypothetical protein
LSVYPKLKGESSLSAEDFIRADRGRSSATAKLNFRSHTQSSHDDHQFSGFSLSSTLVRISPIGLAVMWMGSAGGRFREILSCCLRQVNEQAVTRFRSCELRLNQTAEEDTDAADREARRGRRAMALGAPSPLAAPGYLERCVLLSSRRSRPLRPRRVPAMLGKCRTRILTSRKCRCTSLAPARNVGHASSRDLTSAAYLSYVRQLRGPKI